MSQRAERGAFSGRKKKKSCEYVRMHENKARQCMETPDDLLVLLLLVN